MALFNAVRVAKSGTYYVSGQLPSDLEASVAEQTRSSLENVFAAVREAGIDPKTALKMTIFTTCMDEFAAINEAYAEFFADWSDAEMPTRCAFGVTALAKGAKVEIDCTGEVAE